jgi:hypothetical protein
VLLLLLVVLLLTACGGLAASEPAPPDPTAAPTAAPNPTAAASTPNTLPSATPTPPPDELAQLDAARGRPQDRVLLARALGGKPDAAPVARTTPLDVQVGHSRQFWVNNISDNTNYQITADLRYAGPHVLMYVEQGATVDQARLEEAAQTFEARIYPRTRDLFGSEWQPGVDGDPRIVILHVQSMSGGVIGYFSPRDSVPRSVNRFSNEHEMFYMNVGAAPPGQPSYLDVLTHEFQHMIHWNEQRASATWFDEACATLAEDLNGFLSHSFAATYLYSPDTQLTAWGESPGESAAHYGASNLFLRYIYAHYAGETGLADLLRANAGTNLDAFVQLAARTRPEIADFGDLAADWMLANLLDEPDLDGGRYGYNAAATGLDLLPSTVQPTPLKAGSTRQQVRQFGADYFALPPETRTLRFAGSTAVPLVGAQPQGSHAWWSQRGDNRIATLTRAFDLRGLERATLTYDVWYEIEQGYDYAFASISTDGGTTWNTLPGEHTTTDDPHGLNYGHGLSGVSGYPGQPTGIAERGEWVRETHDLSAYGGQEVLVRFWSISDEGFHAPGMLLDNLSIAELGYTDTVDAGTAGWQAEGFVRVDGMLEQQWEVRLVRTAADGQVRIEPLAVDAAGTAQATLAPGERGVLLVTATTPHTTEPASYELQISQ